MPMVQDFRILRHMLGADDSSTKKARAKWGERNHYAAKPDDESWESLLRLEKAGFVKRGNTSPDTGLLFWHATVKGCQWVGLTAGQSFIATEGHR